VNENDQSCNFDDEDIGEAIEKHNIVERNSLSVMKSKQRFLSV